jgi:replicative DNA helicase
MPSGRPLRAAETGRFNSGFQGFAEALKAAIDMAGNAYQRAGHLSGLATGLDDMDRMMGGLQNSDLVILAGRPGMGKTALATNIAYNVARAWRGEQQPTVPSRRLTGELSASSRWKCRRSSWQRACSPSRPGCPPPTSAAAISRGPVRPHR